MSAGALNSPHILIMSGVGPKDTLQKYNIPLVADLPVGQNLMNHIGLNLYFVMEKHSNDRVLNWATTMDYFLNKQGIMTSTGITQVSFLNNIANNFMNSKAKKMTKSVSKLELN